MSKLRAIALVALIVICGSTMAACSSLPGCGCPCNPCGEGPSN